MAYIGFEDIPAKTIGKRIVPALRKYYRADGTYDLFDLYNYQQNCMHYLSTVNEAGLICTWDYTNTIAELGTYNIDPVYSTFTNTSTFNQLSISHSNGVHYAGRSKTAFTLKFDNRAGLYPYIINCKNASGHGGGGSYVYLKKKGESEEQLVVGGKGNREITWSPEFGIPSQMYDWKDYDYIASLSLALDGTKFTYAYTHLKLSFVHRFTDDHPLYRYYR